MKHITGSLRISQDLSDFKILERSWMMLKHKILNTLIWLATCWDCFSWYRTCITKQEALDLKGSFGSFIKWQHSICQLQYIKIQPKTIDLSMTIQGINPTNSVVIPWSLVLRSIILGWILTYQNWSILSSLVRVIMKNVCPSSWVCTSVWTCFTLHFLRDLKIFHYQFKQFY